MIDILKINVLNTGHITNTYILYNEEKQALIIDPADNFEYIKSHIDSLELKLKYILLTHAHVDHTLALNAVIKNYSNVQLIVNINEKSMLEGKIDDCSNIFNVKQEKRNVTNVKFLTDKDIINLGNINIQMLYTPGHTKGSVCYLVESEKVVFTGDTIFSDSYGRCDLESGSILDMRNSLKKLQELENSGHDYLILPGHGESSNLNEALDNIRRRYELF